MIRAPLTNLSSFPSPASWVGRRKFRILRPLQGFLWRQAFPRMAADFVIVHCSMIAALALSVIYQTGIGDYAAAQATISRFQQYYTAFFWLLSPIFPFVFLLNGFYTHSRAYIVTARVFSPPRSQSLSD
jgi:hypothetical protein